MYGFVYMQIMNTFCSIKRISWNAFIHIISKGKRYQNIQKIKPGDVIPYFNGLL
jgi:hypothetical protein